MERRRELIASLLGPVASAHPLVRCRYGFVDLMFAVRDEMRVGSMPAFDAALKGPLGSFVRDVTLYGDGQRLRELMSSLGERSRPFLTRLSIEGPHNLHYIDLPRELAVRAAGMLPRLKRLEASGRRAVPPVEFPTVREVVANCYDAMPALCASSGGPPCFPLVDRVVLRLVWTVPPLQLESLLPPTQLPALRDLDVSRCTEPVGDSAGYDVFRYLRQTAIAPQLERLRVPGVDLARAGEQPAGGDQPHAGPRRTRHRGLVPLRAELLRHRIAAIRPGGRLAASGGAAVSGSRDRIAPAAAAPRPDRRARACKRHENARMLPRAWQKHCRSVRASSSSAAASSGARSPTTSPIWAGKTWSCSSATA